MSNPFVDVRNLKKYFKVGRNKYLHAVDGVSLSIDKGTTYGLVGESGCGKTTVGRTLVKLYQADSGKFYFNGVDVFSLTRKQKKEFTCKTQMIFQDPYASLNPFFTVGEIISDGMKIHKMYASEEERRDKVYELLEMVGLNREHANRFPHEFSGGQRQRVGIARALAVNPKFIVCDEAISALDVSIQAQIVNLLTDFQKRMGLTYLFIAHDLSMVRYISKKVGVMYLGQIVETGTADEVYENPLHPYTSGLLSSVPIADPRYEKNRKEDEIIGELSSPINPPEGCRFCKRCKYAKNICNAVTPVMQKIDGEHSVACHLYTK